jgi:uncharacterized damage-inducible protein DinB
MRRLCCALLFVVPSFAVHAADFKSEYLTEFALASSRIASLANAMPADKFDWRPGPGVRSVGEVYVHIAETNVLLLGYVGVRVDFHGPRFSGKNSAGEVVARNLEFEKIVHGKDNIVALLERTLDAVKSGLANADMEKPVEMFGRRTTVGAVYLRLLAHANEHTGQAVAYARINGVVPPWSK